MKTNILPIILALSICSWLCNHTAVAQDIDNEALTGIWEKEGTIMGDNGEGWVMPHKHAAPDCGKDHTEFLLDNTAKEVRYAEDCSLIEQSFQWKLEGDKLILSKGDKSIIWHLLSLQNDQLKVGVQVRPNSEHRMYVSFKKRKK